MDGRQRHTLCYTQIAFGKIPISDFEALSRGHVHHHQLRHALRHNSRGHHLRHARRKYKSDDTVPIIQYGRSKQKHCISATQGCEEQEKDKVSAVAVADAVTNEDAMMIHVMNTDIANRAVVCTRRPGYATTTAQVEVSKLSVISCSHGAVLDAGCRRSR